MVVIINKYCGIIKQGLQIVKGETAKKKEGEIPNVI